MPGPLSLPAWLAIAATLLLLAGIGILRASGASPGKGRRLAGARQVRVGELLRMDPGARLPLRPVRVAGRVRCADPIVTAEDDRLVAFHRDVDVQLRDGSWRGIERLRETRSFELWDHNGALLVDPAQASEPLVVLPHVWAGPAAELDETYEPALARIVAEHGEPTGARAATRMVSVIDRLLVLAEAHRDASGAIVLAPPDGGYLISSLDIDDAMRLLGGRRPRLLLGGTALIVLAVILFVLGVVLTTMGA